MLTDKRRYYRSSSKQAPQAIRFDIGGFHRKVVHGPTPTTIHHDGRLHIKHSNTHTHIVPTNDPHVMHVRHLRRHKHTHLIAPLLPPATTTAVHTI